jgi:hypothetical protein
MSTLWIVSTAIWTAGLALAVSEFAGPRRLHCDCRAGFMPHRHLKPRWLLVIGICYVVSDALSIAAGGMLPFTGLVGGWYLWRWWVHTKQNRKKLADRVLGVVRETAAGLKIVPVPGGAR